MEIQYENEVGTGLGPTLEFYALVSTELQRCDLGLWNDNDSYNNKQHESALVATDHVIYESKYNNEKVSSTTETQVSLKMMAETNRLGDINIHAHNNTLVGDNNSQNMIIEQSDEMSILSNENENISKIKDDMPLYVNAPMGLFPAPLNRNAKASHIARLKSKFKFLGKLMAKAVMDSRMVSIFVLFSIHLIVKFTLPKFQLDLPLSIPFYRWLLFEEQTLGIYDLNQVAPEIQATLLRMMEIVKQRDKILADENLDASRKLEKVFTLPNFYFFIKQVYFQKSNECEFQKLILFIIFQLQLLDLDGCPIADLGLDFVLPGHSNIELRRGGKDTTVTIHNLHHYISLVTYWFLNEGVIKQFEALREGNQSINQSIYSIFYFKKCNSRF